MRTTINELNGELVAAFEGRLDTAAAIQTEKDVQPLADCAGKNIVLDCSALEYISSSGLRIFLNVLKNAKAKGSRVFITGMSDDINKVFRITGFMNLFEFR
ncbi:MAG: STAS domain-containing protein [Bacteroidales bacterium]|nr:STAS domain-containing protein [Bacteroidales bacterium]MDY6347221.1 STAS domain-containing protein [Bacteroidales bacterium]